MAVSVCEQDRFGVKERLVLLFNRVSPLCYVPKQVRTLVNRVGRAIIIDEAFTFR